MRTVKKVCPDCGSDEIRRDATARWSVEMQAWVLSSLQEFCVCVECGEDFYTPNSVYIE